MLWGGRVGLEPRSTAGGCAAREDCVTAHWVIVAQRQQATRGRKAHTLPDEVSGGWVMAGPRSIATLSVSQVN